MSISGIPNGWLSRPFPKVVNRYQSKGGKLKTAEYEQSGPLSVVDQGQPLVVGFCSEESRRFQGPYPIIVFGDHTRNVKLVDFPFAVGADGVVLLGPSDRNALDIKFLYYWLKYVPLHNLGYSRHFKLLKGEDISFPEDTNEQRRIVARIEQLTRRAEEALKLRQEAVEELGKTFVSAIDKIFADRDKDWTEGTVKQLCGKPQYGYTESANAESIGPRFLRITDIQNGRVDWDTVPHCRCSETRKYQLYDGDIVFARTGATTGKSYLVRNPPAAVFASYLIRIRTGEKVLPEYIWWYFQSSSYWASVFSGIDDGNRPNMNGTKLGNLKIPFPKSKGGQKNIVARIEAISEKIYRLHQLQTETDAELGAFQSSLFAKAFRGEL